MAVLRIRRKRKPTDPLEMMEDIEVTEVSLVDTPATGKPFVLFKSASGKAGDFAGHGNPSLPPSFPMPRETPDQRTRGPLDETLGSLEQLLEATLDGDNSTVDDMGKKVPEGVERETFERCVEEVEAKIGDKGRAYAICTAGGAGAGKRRLKADEDHVHEVPLPDGSTVTTGPPLYTTEGPPMGSEIDTGAAPPFEPGKRKERTMRVKEDPVLPPDMPVEGPPAEGAGVIEVPATPTEWSLTDCIAQGMELGLSEDNAVQVCQRVRGDYGDPSDEAMILVPQGESTEGLISGAAIELGFATLSGGGAPKRFTGQNRWAKKFKQFLGLASAKPYQADPSDLVRLAKALKGVTEHMEKTKDDLRAYIEGQQRENARLHEENQTLIGIMARGMGIEMPTPAPVATPLTPATASAPVTEPATGRAAITEGPPPAVVEAAAAAGPGKALKDGEMSATIEERLNLIEEALATLLAGGMMAGPPPDATVPGDATVGMEAPLKRLLRSSVPAVTRTKGVEGDLEFSSTLNAYVSKADREAASLVGGPLRHRR